MIRRGDNIEEFLAVWGSGFRSKLGASGGLFLFLPLLARSTGSSGGTIPVETRAVLPFWPA